MKHMPGVFMRKTIVLVIILVFVFAMSGCGNKNANLVGDWAVVSQGTSRFGYMLRFERDGRMYCAPEMNSGTIRSIDEEFRRTSSYYSLNYKIKDSKTLELAVTIFGVEIILKVDYKIDGDSLIFDGGTYRRLDSA